MLLLQTLKKSRFAQIHASDMPMPKSQQLVLGTIPASYNTAESGGRQRGFLKISPLFNNNNIKKLKKIFFEKLWKI
jgi:hypothetical protein